MARYASPWTVTHGAQNSDLIVSAFITSGVGFNVNTSSTVNAGRVEIANIDSATDTAVTTVNKGEVQVDRLSSVQVLTLNNFTPGDSFQLSYPHQTNSSAIIYQGSGGGAADQNPGK